MSHATTTMPRPPRPKRNDIVTKIDAEVYRMARIVAAYEERPIAEVMSEYLRPILDQKLQEFSASHVSHPKPKRRD